MSCVCLCNKVLVIRCSANFRASGTASGTIACLVVMIYNDLAGTPLPNLSLMNFVRNHRCFKINIKIYAAELMNQVK